MEINLTCRINNTSLGYYGLHILRALSTESYDVAYWPIEDADRINAPTDFHTYINKGLSQRGKYNIDAPSVRYSHPNDLAQHVGRGPRIGNTIFELNKFQLDEYHHMASQDALIIGSAWGKKVLEENSLIKPIGIVPYGVDRNVFNEDVQPFLSFQDNPTTFINVSKKEIRKGHVELLEAFNLAFEPTDNVVLILCWYNRFYSAEENIKWNNAAQSSKMGSRIYIHKPGEFLDSQSEVAQLCATADCGVYPSKAEGFGLQPLELMSMGKFSIVTNYSGHTEYCTQDNSLLIDIDEMEDAYDSKWFFGQGQWANFGPSQTDQLVEHMRRVHILKQSGQLKLNENGLETAKFFSWERSAKQMVNFLETLN